MNRLKKRGVLSGKKSTPQTEPTATSSIIEHNFGQADDAIDLPKPVAIAIGNAEEIRKAADALDAIARGTKRSRALGRAVLGKHWRRFVTMFPSETERSVIIRQLIAQEARGELSAFIFAMSWQALKWAAQQQAGDLSANAVLRVYADHADQSGRTWVDSNTIAKELHTSQPTVLNATARILKRGLMRDTKERSGQTGHVRVFQLKIPRENKRTSSFSVSRSKSANKRTSNAKATLKQHTSNAQAASAFHDTRARRSFEPGTRNHENVVRSPKNELLISDHKDDKNFVPAWSRPKDANEVWEYIYSAADETKPLERYFSEHEDDDEGDRDIDYWLHANEKKGWDGVTDWRVHLKETFLRGWFPSQKRKSAKRRPK